MKLIEPVTFDLPYGDITVRVRMDKHGLRMWKRSVGNLDGPRAYDQYIDSTWESIGNSGTCYAGSQSGHFQRGPASGRAGLNYLTKAKTRKSRFTEEETVADVQTGTPTKA
jgi:hypothetical protein